MSAKEGKNEEGQAPSVAPSPLGGAGAYARYEEVIELPSRIPPGKVTVMEMMGTEEALLTKVKKLKDGSAIETVMSRCVKEDIDMGELMIGDRYLIMVKLRQITHGDDYQFGARCPMCSESFDNSMDLSDVVSKIKFLEGEPDELHELTLPRTKQKVVWKHIRGKDEKTILKARKQAGDDDSSIIMSLRLHTVSIDGQERLHPDFPSNLPALDLRAFREDVADKACGIDTTVGVECPECGHDFRLEMPLSEDFFWPSATRNSGGGKYSP